MISVISTVERLERGLELNHRQNGIAYLRECLIVENLKVLARWLVTQDFQEVGEYPVHPFDRRDAVYILPLAPRSSVA